ncbi:MAG: M14 family metallopeptidase [Pseudomonadota bacterium]|nr:M14 family metallopeptidase [Pseudomonadota bacterium]
MRTLLTCAAVLSTFLAASSVPAMAAEPALTTVAERSGFRQTGRYDEVIALCGAFAKRYPDAVRCHDFGTTPEGRPMKVLVVSKAGAFTPEAARERDLPVMLVQGGIHAGEIDGKDAGFLALRQALENEAAPGALARQVLLFVPVFNVDGHERFGAWNRPNQRGPEQMGWRTTAQNYNLNRDYVKADSPEMQAMLGLIEQWDPVALVDLHVTNGAKFEHDISIQVEPLYSGDAVMRAAGLELRTTMLERLAAQGSLPLPFYPSFVVNDDPTSGFADGVAPPRFSHGYMPLRNRFGMLVETHSWKEYPQRVRATRNTVVAMMELMAEQGLQWRAIADAADARASKLAGQTVPLDYKAGDEARLIDFRGYEYSRTPSRVSGALMTRYDDTKPQLWNVPLRDQVQPGRTVQAPRAGYIIPAAQAQWVQAKLDQHGIAYRRLERASPRAEVEAFRAGTTEFSPRPLEGHQMLSLTGSWAPEARSIDTGALFVPIAQPKARLVIALLEPQAPDSLAAWGEFNNHFERKEYMEDYVAEEVAEQMLAADPELRRTFEQRLQDDPGFAASAQARLDFFYRRHSAWDERFDLYPVLRTDTAPQ